MKKERKSTLFSIILNFIVANLKIVGGIIMNSYTLLTNGYYTLSNFSEDVLAYAGGIANHKRANRKHPFGFGQSEYFIHILVGFLFITIALNIFARSLFLEYAEANPLILFLIISVTLIEFLNANYLLQIGKDIHSQMLFASSHNSYYDALLTIISTLFILLSVWVSFFDFLGTLLNLLIICYKGIKIISNNIIMIRGQNDNSKKIIDNIKKIINKTKNVTYSNVSLINVADYYSITLEIGIADRLTMGELIKLESLLKKKIRKNIKTIKNIDFEILKK